MSQTTDPNVTYIEKHGFKVLVGHEKAGVYVIRDQTNLSFLGVVMTINRIVRRETATASVSTSYPTSYNLVSFRFPTEIMAYLHRSEIRRLFGEDVSELAKFNDQVDEALPYDDQLGSE